MPPKRKLTAKGEVPVERVRRTFKCSHEGCTNQSRTGGVCTRHGAKRTGCSHEGCTSRAVKGGVCTRHGAECNHEGCTNGAYKGGVCIRHGAKIKRCSKDGCTNQSQKGGVCKRHGAEFKKCSHEGCTNNVQKGGVCCRHGAETRGCREEGCTNIAVNGGVCKRHGAEVAKPKQCSHEGYTTQAKKLNDLPVSGELKSKFIKRLKGAATTKQEQQQHFDYLNQNKATSHSCAMEMAEFDPSASLATLNSITSGGVGVKHTQCRHEGCSSQAMNRRVCIKHGAKNWKEKQEHYVSDSEGSGSRLLTDNNKHESREAAQAIFVPPSLPSQNGQAFVNQRVAAIHAGNANGGWSEAVDVATRDFVNGNMYVLDIDESSTAVGIFPISPPNAEVCKPILEPKMGPATPQQHRYIDPTVQRTDVADQALMVQRLQQENEELRKKIVEATVAKAVAEREALEATKKAINATVAKVMAERYATVVNEAVEQETLVAEKRAADAERRLKEIIEIKEATEQK